MWAMRQEEVSLTAGAIVRASPFSPYVVADTPRRNWLNSSVQLLGATLSWGLYRCLIVPLYTYYTAPATATSSERSKDPKWLLGIVGTLGVLESGYTMTMTHSAWVYIVDLHTTTVLHQSPGPWTSAACPAITGLDFDHPFLDRAARPENMESVRDVVDVVEAQNRHSGDHPDCFDRRSSVSYRSNQGSNLFPSTA
ncbi:hypothetical protein AX16_003507 [Volvariella volvacea WC 439]|nr:hypothetical protein AX16_003507 [Volvariella volvacea WC 439]